MLQRVTLLGNLCADPELKHLPTGVAVCEMRIATNERWTDKDGKKQEKAEFHRCVVWNKLAENCAKYLVKGRLVYVEGKLRTRSWEKDGEKRYATEIVASEVKFIGGGNGGGARKEEGGGGDGDPGPFAEDDLPF